MKLKIIYHTIRDSIRKERNYKFFKLISILLGIILTILLIISVYASYFYYADCQTEACFLTHLQNCDRATFLQPGEFSLNYKITGYSLKSCGVDVSLVYASKDYELRDFYQNSSMFCRTNLGSGYYPESDLGKCEGILKEGFQEVIIDRLKVEIVRNIGDINLDVLKTP